MAACDIGIYLELYSGVCIFVTDVYQLSKNLKLKLALSAQWFALNPHRKLVLGSVENSSVQTGRLWCSDRTVVLGPESHRFDSFQAHMLWCP